jgi:tetratricopeptide (TPR) repeat protein
MAPERPSGGDARHRRVRPEVTLQPPPRAGAAFVTTGEGSAARGGGVARALAAAAALGALAAATAFVFLVLPKWVRNAPPPSAAVAPPVAALRAPATPAASPAVTPREAAPAPDPMAEDEPPVASARPAARPPATAAAAARPPAEDPAAGEYARAMSEGLAALERGEFAAAKAALARAEAARPGTRVVADAARRADEGLGVEALAGHRARGQAAEAREEWRGALAEYEAALKLDPRVAFAQEGRARTLARAELDERLAGYLQRPERLAAQNVAAEAERALFRARETEPATPRLQQQAAALERLLAQARTPVDVHLLSDGATEVVVQRVGALGTFRQRTLALRPGSYVVVGRRRGYRDTRKTLVVSPAGTPALEVRCDQTL